MHMFAGLICLILTSCHVLSFPQNATPNVEPEYLDMLLETNQYELFSKLMKIDNVNLVRPNERERTEKPIYHKDIPLGDILPSRPATEEESRQGLRFDLYPRSKWRNGYVPYVISKHYSPEDRKIIQHSIKSWNERVSCIKWEPRTNENDYVMIFNGDGCYSNMGRTGGQQPLSLEDDGCLYEATILHEMEHAIGIAHEHNRGDRDEYIEMLWDNILEDWKSQYEKIGDEEYKNIGVYDYYSIMHYDTTSPETDEQAFNIKDENVNSELVGNVKNFSTEDLEKIANLYCSKNKHAE